MVNVYVMLQIILSQHHVPSHLVILNIQDLHIEDFFEIVKHTQKGFLIRIN